MRMSSLSHSVQANTASMIMIRRCVGGICRRAVCDHLLSLRFVAICCAVGVDLYPFDQYAKPRPDCYDKVTMVLDDLGRIAGYGWVRRIGNEFLKSRYHLCAPGCRARHEQHNSSKIAVIKRQCTGIISGYTQRSTEMKGLSLT